MLPTLMLLLLACTAPAPVVITDVEATLDETVATLVRVSWHQDGEASTYVSFTADDVVGVSPSESLPAGDHEAWILGAPADTEVVYRVLAETDTGSFESAEETVRTGPVPEDLTEDLLGPVVETWEPDPADSAQWLLGSVDVDGGPSYSGPFWLFLIDRAGRFVWWRELYYDSSMFPRVARDGTHIAWDQRPFLDPTGETAVVRRASLDGTRTADVPTPRLGWCWDETTDGAVLYDRHEEDGTSGLVSVDTDGVATTLWDCTAWQTPLDPDPEHCYTNTVNWSEERDSVLWSTYWGNWVVELDRASGEVLWYAGLDGGLAFDPPESAFDLQHYPNWTPDGTLIVSTHIVGEKGEQRAREFEVGTDALTEVWSYGEGVDSWARYSGEAVRLPSGNTLINYGTGGQVREITPDGETVWLVSFGDERTLGHTQLVTDLYALNRGP